MINLDHLNAAMAVWSYSVDSVRHIFGSRLKNPDTNDLIEFLVPGSSLLAPKTAEDWVDRTALHGSKSGHLKKAKLDEAILIAKRNDLIECRMVLGKGRPSQQYRLSKAGRVYAGCE